MGDENPWVSGGIRCHTHMSYKHILDTPYTRSISLFVAGNNGFHTTAPPTAHHSGSLHCCLCKWAFSKQVFLLLQGIVDLLLLLQRKLLTFVREVYTVVHCYIISFQLLVQLRPFPAFQFMCHLQCITALPLASLFYHCTTWSCVLTLSPIKETNLTSWRRVLFLWTKCIPQTNM